MPIERPSLHRRLAALLIVGVAFGASRLGPLAAAAPPVAITAAGDTLARRIPTRAADAPTGSRFSASIRGLDLRQRERAIARELAAGNIPPFLRRLVPVTLNGARDGHGRSATIFVTPDYLAIGDDGDFLRVPMNLETAAAVAQAFGFVLPTRRMVDAIYAQSTHHFVPEPLPAGPTMSSTEYYERHNRLIETQARIAGVVPGTLVSGHKKDLVLTNRLEGAPGRLAIYGWQRPDGTPIQPLSTVHGACYEDYSHGVRLVSADAWMDGALRPIGDLLTDARTAPILSDEGALRVSATVAGGLRQAVTPGSCSSGSRDGN